MSQNFVENSILRWHESNKTQCKSAEVTQQRAESAIDEAELAGQKCIERATYGKKLVNHKLEERIEDLQFRHSELDLQKKKVEDELADLTAVLKRVSEASSKCLEPLQITRKCLEQRLNFKSTQLF